MNPRKKLERQMLKGFLKEFPSVDDDRAEEILQLVYDNEEEKTDGTQIPVVNEGEEPRRPRDVEDDSVVEEVREDAERMLDEKIAELEEEQEENPGISSFDDALEQMQKESEEYKKQVEEDLDDQDEKDA